MAKIGSTSRPLAKITMRSCLAMRGALRAAVIARERLMVFFARGREIVPIFAMSDPWLASKSMEHTPRAIVSTAAVKQKQKKTNPLLSNKSLTFDVCSFVCQ